MHMQRQAIRKLNRSTTPARSLYHRKSLDRIDGLQLAWDRNYIPHKYIFQGICHHKEYFHIPATQVH